MPANDGRAHGRSLPPNHRGCQQQRVAEQHVHIMVVYGEQVEQDRDAADPQCQGKETAWGERLVEQQRRERHDPQRSGVGEDRRAAGLDEFQREVSQPEKGCDLQQADRQDDGQIGARWQPQSSLRPQQRKQSQHAEEHAYGGEP